LKELVTLEGCRVRKDDREVRMSAGYLQFSKLIGALLEEMRSQQQIRADVNLDALRAGLIGMTEGLLRARVVASRSDSSIDYSFDDMRKVLEAMVPVMGSESEQRLKVVNG
jgi:hypothetical protein